MRRSLNILIIVVVVGLAYWLLRPNVPPVREQAYISERRATVWNRLATVREPAATLRYGDRVGILESKTWSGIDYVRVLVSGGADGWMEAKQLMLEELWLRALSNLEKSKSMPRQAIGKTKVLTNLRTEPGRSAQRSFQFGRDVPVEILARAVVERPPEASPPAKKPDEQTVEQPEAPRQEDWLFIRGHDTDAGDLAGWVLGRFIELDLPAPLRDLGAGIRFVAWFELSRIPDTAEELGADEKPEAGEPAVSPTMKPQYLAAGVMGGEGQPCDFTLLRFYTWNAARHRYETAYVESNFCARLPIRVTPIPPGANLEKSEASIGFTAVGKSGDETREYRMRQNILRRLREKR
ncbi:MAG: hypothetical protein M1453_04680 [Acidobacteria bacterium]|nr:hypothetical protein [Acidobacteriota bacterium]MCL5287276.1 hypothetical protein [Acidobacteriota bacterium]